jgi:hypothetical protein
MPLQKSASIAPSHFCLDLSSLFKLVDDLTAFD